MVFLLTVVALAVNAAGLLGLACAIQLPSRNYGRRAYDGLRYVDW